MRRVVVVLACALLLPWIAAFLVWDGLPERIPFHFDLRGQADRFVTRTWLNWLLLPIIATGLTAFLGAIMWFLPWLARTAPEWINVPGKAAFVQLPVAARVRVVQPTQWLLLGCAATLDVMFGAMILGIARVADGTWSTLPVWTTVPFLGVIGVILVLGIRASLRAVRRETAHPSSTHPSSTTRPGGSAPLTAGADR